MDSETAPVVIEHEEFEEYAKIGFKVLTSDVSYPATKQTSQSLKRPFLKVIKIHFSLWVTTVLLLLEKRLLPTTGIYLRKLLDEQKVDSPRSNSEETENKESSADGSKKSDTSEGAGAVDSNENGASFTWDDPPAFPGKRADGPGHIIDHEGSSHIPDLHESPEVNVADHPPVAQKAATPVRAL